MVINFKTMFYTVAILLLSTFHGIGQNANNLSSEPITLDTTIIYGKLDNGFKYFLKSDHTHNGEVAMKLVVKAGYYHEEDSQLEYAHLIEHVALFHTEMYPEVYTLLKDFNIVSNAYTQETSTNYWLKIPNANSDLIKLGVNVLKDKVQSMSMDIADIDRERGSLLGEMRRKNPHLEWLNQNLEEVMYANIDYPLVDREKKINNVKNFNLKAFKKFYRKWYRPDRMGIIIVGDINTDSLQETIRETFADFKNPVRDSTDDELLRKYEVRLSGNNQYVSLTDSIDKSRRLIILKKYKNYKYKVNSELDYKMMMTQELYKYIVEKRGKSLLEQYNPPYLNFSFKEMAKGQISMAKTSIELNSTENKLSDRILNSIQVFEKLSSNFTQLELAEAKEVLREEYSKLSFDPFKWTVRLKDYMVYNTAVLTPQKIPEIIKTINGISLKDLQAFSEVAGNFSVNTDFVFMNVPGRIIPGKKLVDNLFAQVAAGNIWDYHPPSKNVQSIENVLPPIEKAFPPDKAKQPIYTDSENILGITTITFKEGLKVVLKPIRPSQENYKDQVEIHAYKPIKKYKDAEQDVLRELAHSYPIFTGAGPYNHFEIEKFKINKGIRMHFYSDQKDYRIDGSFKRDKLKEFFNLLLLYSKKPEDDREAFEYWKKRKIEQLGDAYVRSSKTFFDDDIAKIRNPDLPNVTKTAVENLDFETFIKAYRDQFSSFNNYTFIITGDFKTEEILPEFKNYLGALPSKQIHKKSHNIHKDFILEDSNDTIFYDNFNQAFVKIDLPVKVSNDIKSRIMLEYIGLALYERIFERLRTGTYAPGAGGQWMDFDREIYAFTVRFDSELGNLDTMLKYTNEVISDLRNNGIDQEWLNYRLDSTTKKLYERLNMMGILNFWPKYLKAAMENNENPEDYLLKYGTIAEHFIDADEVNEMIKTLFAKTHKQIFIALPKGYNESKQ